MTEDEKILHILDLMDAKSPETAVTTEKMIDKAIEEGATKDVFTDNWHGHKEGDHPWWLLLAAMSGTGSEAEVEKHNVPYLHRKKVPGVKNGRKTQVYVYWYDESFSHEITYTGKVYREKVAKQQEIKDLIDEIERILGNQPLDDEEIERLEDLKKDLEDLLAPEVKDNNVLHTLTVMVNGEMRETVCRKAGETYILQPAAAPAMAMFTPFTSTPSSARMRM
jgi:hypothetical protein